MLTYNDVENIIKERGDCGIRGDKLRKLLIFLIITLKTRILLLYLNL